MRILYGTEAYPPSINGVAVFARNLAAEMVRRGHEVTVIATSSDFSCHTENDEGVEVRRIRSLPTILHSQRFSPFDRKHIADIVAEKKPDIVHIQNHFFIGSAVMGAAKKMRIPVVGTNHIGPNDIISFVPLPRIIRRVLDGWMWRDLGKKFNKCNFITAPSSFTFTFFERFGAAAPGKVISNGIDLKIFTNKRSGVEPALRKKYALPDKPIVLYVGRLDPGKELDVWIRSIPHVLKKTDAHFVTLGPGVLTKEMKLLAGILKVAGHITFIDAVPYNDVAAFYRLADVFAISSIMESQGLVVLEAMASGLPIAAADCAALPELVKDNENGLLFPPGDFIKMADTIVRILNDRELAKRLGCAGLLTAEKHDIQKTFDEFEQVYRGQIGI